MSTPSGSPKEPELQTLSGEITPEELESCIRLLQREDVMRLCQAASRRALGSSRLATTPLPAGLSQNDTKNLLAATQRLFAVRSPMWDRTGYSTWFTMTREILHSLQSIDSHCTDESLLSAALANRDSKRFVVHSRVNDAISAIKLDGVPLDFSAVKDLIFMRRHPASDGERVAMNTYRLLADIESVASHEWTPEFLQGLYEQLCDGIAHEPFDPGRALATGAAAMHSYEILAMVCDYANTDVLFHPAIAAIVLGEVFRYWTPFPAWNATIGALAFKILAVKRGYGVMATLAVEHTRLRWKDGDFLLPGDSPQAPRNEPSLFPRYGEADTTVYITENLQLITIALADLQRTVELQRKRDIEIRDVLYGDAGLNHRQRSILARALRLPDAKFRIRYHQTTHNIAYATARADLIDLAERGYLTYENTGLGAPFIFYAAPDLAQRLHNGEGR